MKVILLQELKGKGIEGDIIDAADGFANNYLLPRKIAVKATKGNLKQLDMRRDNIAKREKERVAAANQLKEQLDGQEIHIDARVGEAGQLFGSVAPAMIASALKDQKGIEVDRRLIDLNAPIRVAGIHQATITLHHDIKATIKVTVGDPEAIKAAQEAQEAEKSNEEAANTDEAAAETEAAEKAVKDIENQENE